MADRVNVTGVLAESAIPPYYIAGGAAGNHTVTGVLLAHDKIHKVIHITTGATAAAADLTSEFSITADNTINNTGGTATTNDLLIVYVYRFGRTLRDLDETTIEAP